jgi:hypothetical protein
MSRYIDKVKLLEKAGELEALARARVRDTPTDSLAFQKYCAQLLERANFIDVIKEQPIADVVEVRHGYWVRIEDHNAYESEHFCSECLADGSYDVSNEKYCYNCGAKMDGERRTN